ncbi:MAG: DUF1684 domain-containing protein [Bifidobacterium breve]
MHCDATPFGRIPVYRYRLLQITHEIDHVGTPTYSSPTRRAAPRPPASAADILTLDHIDFNYAFNYPCAFSLFCTCPIPSKRNHLPFAVTAGEKTPKEYQY